MAKGGRGNPCGKLTPFWFLLLAGVMFLLSREARIVEDLDNKVAVKDEISLLVGLDGSWALGPTPRGSIDVITWMRYALLAALISSRGS
jgi:hypothetical protein